MKWVVGGFCGSVWAIGEWEESHWIIGVISFGHFGLFGLFGLFGFFGLFGLFGPIS